MDVILDLAGNGKFLAVLAAGIIVLTVVIPQYLRGRSVQPEKKRMCRKIKATATGIDRILSRKDEGELWINYAFTVDGKEYTGGGRYNHAEYDLFRKVTVFYDPEDPSKNCTNLERAQKGTAGAIFWLGLTLVMLVLTLLFAE